MQHAITHAQPAAQRGGLRTLLLLVPRNRPVNLLALLAQVLNACQVRVNGETTKPPDGSAPRAR